MKRRSQTKVSRSKNTYGAKKRSKNMMYGFNPHFKHDVSYKDYKLPPS